MAVEGGDAADVELARGAQQPAALHPGVEAGNKVGVKAIEGLGRAAGLGKVFLQGFEAGTVFGDLVAPAGAVDAGFLLDDLVEVFDDADSSVDRRIVGVYLP